MIKEFTSLGLMSGTSGDGVDASIIQSNGDKKYKLLLDKYYQYDNEIYNDLHKAREKINNSEDLKKHRNELKNLSRKITIFHAKIIQELSSSLTIDLVGFHGQTIFHSSKEKISKQIGDAHLLSQLTKKDIIFNFRQNDILNGGEGAPLTPIFHQLLASKLKLKLPICFLNIGGIANITIVNDLKNLENFTSKDIGPGNCLIDTWIRKNTNNKYDIDGELAQKGTKNQIILEQVQDFFSQKFNQQVSSLDVNDFDISFARGLSPEDGAATLTELTAKILGSSLSFNLSNQHKQKSWKILICGGGRKNKFLIKKIKENIPRDYIIEDIDKHGVDGDFVESQAFGYLAIRSILNLPISFPNTTQCKKPTVGGELVKFK